MCCPDQTIFIHGGPDSNIDFKQLDSPPLNPIVPNDVSCEPNGITYVELNQCALWTTQELLLTSNQSMLSYWTICCVRNHIKQKSTSGSSKPLLQAYVNWCCQVNVPFPPYIVPETKLLFLNCSYSKMNPIIICLVESSLVKFSSQSEFSPDLKFTAKKNIFSFKWQKYSL